MDLFEILSPSGREEGMNEYIKEYAKSYGYKCRNDVFGNLICEKGENIKYADSVIFSIILLIFI